MTADLFRRRLATLRASAAVRQLLHAVAPRRLWLVGGTLRDAALGLVPADLDVLVERGAAEAAARLAEDLEGRVVRLGGERFAALRVVRGERVIDFWELGDTALATELERRDLTINAMALELPSGELVDLFGGLQDLERRRLRATRASVFVEDPLRVVRLARFKAALAGFRPDAATTRWARAAASRLVAVPGERIRSELAELWGGTAFASAQRALSGTGVWPGLWSDAPSEPARRAAQRASALDRALDRLATPMDPGARIACGHVLSARCAAASGAAAALTRLAKRQALSGDERRKAHHLLALAAEAPPRTPPDLAWLLHRAGRLWPWALALGHTFAAGSDRRRWRIAIERAPALLAERSASILEPPRLLDGECVAELLGGGAGPAVGAALEHLREAQVRGEIVDREGAEERLATWRQAASDAQRPLPIKR